MKVICNRGALLEALVVTGNVVAPRTPKPALLCVKLTAADNSLSVAATDMEVAIRYTDNQVQIEAPGEALLPADKLRDIARESSDDTLSIEVTGDTAHVRGQDAHFKVFTQKVEEFPAVPALEGEPDFQIPGAALKTLIGQTIFSVAKEASRYAFNGVLLQANKGKKIALVSTDGRRLAQAKGDASESTAKDGLKAIIPAKAMTLIEKLIQDPTEAVGFQLRPNQVICRTSNAMLTSNLLEGQFPPFEDVIPKDCDKKMTCATADFLSAVRRAALLATEESKGVRLQFSKKGLVLTSRSAEAGEATVNFPCKYEGTDVEIGFNPHFLMDALRVAGTEEITLELTTASRPGLLRAGSSFVYVIMPVNLQ